ncbi:unnamed protein product [Pseudo-nitzschia multistriata]|uniref:ATP-dependent DNA helicase n=1 Tax=Pseudo-nitzschia multistriata TaxID=183589 RepID=A0A448YV89_9STRA|nr:unnamed protein product [Pseudo-nitzschia multistriata]
MKIRRGGSIGGTTQIYCWRGWSVAAAVRAATAVLLVVANPNSFSVSVWFATPSATKAMAMAMVVRRPSGRSLSFVARAAGHLEFPGARGRTTAPTLGSGASSARHGNEGGCGPFRRTTGGRPPTSSLLRSSSSSTSTGSTETASGGETGMPVRKTREEALLAALEEYRSERARSLSKSPAQVLSNAVLRGICSETPTPTTRAELLGIRGLGPKTLRAHGDGILDVLSSTAGVENNNNNNSSSNNSSNKDGDAIDGAVPDPFGGAPNNGTAGFVGESAQPPQPGGNGPLREALEEYRASQARLLGKFPTQILANTVLDRICASEPLPATTDQLLEGIKGLGPKKVSDFGDGILGVLSAYNGTAGSNSNSSASNDDNNGNKYRIAPVQTTKYGMAKDSYGIDDVSLFSMEAGATYYHVAPQPAPTASSPAVAGTNEADPIPGAGNHPMSAADPVVAVPDLASDPEGPEQDSDDDDEVLVTLDTAPYLAPLDDDAPDPDLDLWETPEEHDNWQEDTVSSSSFSVDSFVAPAPYSAPVDDYVSPAPFSYDSYVAPAPFSYLDDHDKENDEYDSDYDEDDVYGEEDYEISEESFGADSPPKSETETVEKEEPKTTNATTKISKTQLKKDLKEYRLQQKEGNKPAYTVFTNAALDGIYRELPTTESELLDVKGIGPKKVELYGDDILDMVSKYTGIKARDRGGGDDEAEGELPLAPKQIEFESLTEEQRKAAEWIFGNAGEDHDEEDSAPRNVFVTGSAGTGKSHLLKYIVHALQSRESDGTGEARVGVCAPTGVAAVIVGGSTLHSFFGIGLGKGSPSSILQKVRKNSSAMDRIDDTDVLIIDECSMMSSELLETLDMVSRRIRNGGVFRDEPFGGMQVIAFGDFFQLPPVYRNDGTKDWTWRPFCFESPVWEDLGLSENVVELREVQRQEHGDFVDLLNKVRIGKVTEQDIRELNRQCLIGPNNPIPTDGILPTRLYVLNKDVDSENINRLAELKGREIVCKASDNWRQSMPLGTPAATKKKMKESIAMEIPDEVRLKIGAQVMLTRNKDLQRNLVNGSRGVVERIVKGPEGNPVPIVRFDSGLVTKVPPVESERFNPDGGPGCLVRKQIPLKLAWAITIHKSQGSTLTRASLDISSAFEYGQCYVALSRVKSLEGLWLEKPASLRHIKVSPQVVDAFGGLE